MTVGNMQFGTLNSAGSDETTLEADNLTNTLLVENGIWDAITGRGSNVGVNGYADPQGELGVGVYGQGRVGVFAFGTGAGVIGDSFDNRGGQGDGVVGRSNVYGHNAVKGEHYGQGVAVRAQCDQGFGVYSESKTSVGVGAVSQSSVAIQGVAGAFGLAGAFYGDVVVRGNLTVVPPGVKSMAMPHPDGSYRRLYVLESPESWIEDFGSGEIVGGYSHVDLDPDFAAIAQLADYYVFLTPEGDSSGLYVADKSPTGFDVREQRGGTSNLRFSYRIVARPIPVEGSLTERMPRMDVPAAQPTVPVRPEAEPPELPRLPRDT